MPELLRLALPARVDLRQPDDGQRGGRGAGGAAELAGAGARTSSPGPAIILAFENDDNELCAERIEVGWTRIGRSGSADVRFDDATVSRRHALIVLTEEGGLRALDDRSLNGLFVNGERVDWSPLDDGDELEIGRYRLYVLSV